MSHAITPLATGVAIMAVVLSAATAFNGWGLLLALGVGGGLLLLANESSAPAAPPPFRLEHRRPGEVCVLATARDQGSGQARLQERAARLKADGASGQLVLVEVATGHVVIWHVLGPRPAERAAA